MRGKPGYEHLNEPLHILVEAELPVEIIDARLMQAREILEDLLKPVVSTILVPSVSLSTTSSGVELQNVLLLWLFLKELQVYAHNVIFSVLIIQVKCSN